MNCFTQRGEYDMSGPVFARRDKGREKKLQVVIDRLGPARREAAALKKRAEELFACLSSLSKSNSDSGSGSGPGSESGSGPAESDINMSDSGAADGNPNSKRKNHPLNLKATASAIQRRLTDLETVLLQIERQRLAEILGMARHVDVEVTRAQIDARDVRDEDARKGLEDALTNLSNAVLQMQAAYDRYGTERSGVIEARLIHLDAVRRAQARAQTQAEGGTMGMIDDMLALLETWGTDTSFGQQSESGSGSRSGSGFGFDNNSSEGGGGGGGGGRRPSRPWNCIVRGTGPDSPDSFSSGISSLDLDVDAEDPFYSHSPSPSPSPSPSLPPGSRSPLSSWSLSPRSTPDDGSELDEDVYRFVSSTRHINDPAYRPSLDAISRWLGLGDEYTVAALMAGHRIQDAFSEYKRAKAVSAAAAASSSPDNGGDDVFDLDGGKTRDPARFKLLLSLATCSLEQLRIYQREQPDKSDDDMDAYIFGRKKRNNNNNNNNRMPAAGGRRGAITNAKKTTTAAAAGPAVGWREGEEASKNKDGDEEGLDYDAAIFARRAVMYLEGSACYDVSWKKPSETTLGSYEVARYRFAVALQMLWFLENAFL